GTKAGPHQAAQCVNLSSSSMTALCRAIPLTRDDEQVMTAGNIARCHPEQIHSIWNVGKDISMSLHTYGRHINYAGRSQFTTSACGRSARKSELGAELHLMSAIGPKRTCPSAPHMSAFGGQSGHRPRDRFPVDVA